MIYNLMKKKYAPLIFSLISGLAYFMVALKFIKTYTHQGGGLLALFFAPAIICGMALVLVKCIKNWQEDENIRAVTVTFWLHALLLVIGVVFVISII